MAVSVMGNIPALKETQQQLKSRMEKAVEDFRANLASTRTGRASVHMLDQVKVPYYGSDMPLNQVATILKEVEAKSVRKKMKDKAFARSVNRDDIINGAADLGVDLEEHIAFCIEAMKGIAGELGLVGTA